jgi:hypothetical protein
MAHRGQWTFSYKVGDVLEGAQRQLAYHERKEAKWRAIEAQREEEARQSISMAQTFEHIGGLSTAVAQPQYDAAKLNALHEAQTHRKDHQGRAAQYRTWISVLAAQPATLEIQLDYDDVVFFGLATNQE